MGNIWSVQSAVNFLGVTCEVISEPDHIDDASHVILPGVGSFRVAMETLRSRGMVDGVVDWVRKGNGCLLGICLGMQLLARESDEDGVTEGFGFLHQRVEYFRSDSDHSLRIPHVGFNSLTFEEPEGIFSGLESGCDFYFVHSYRISDQASGGRRGYTTYGEPFLAAIELENVWGAQFHPEKSQSNGLRLLSNFLETTLHSC
jgi:glutamine amidotransferase